MCPALLNSGQRFCPKHEHKNKKRISERRSNDEISKWYKRAFWLKFQAWFLRQHPLCARVLYGVRCYQPATLVHHRKSPRTDPELFTTEDNCVGLCANHHHGGEGDRPHDVYAGDL
jgi:hypothetical protein